MFNLGVINHSKTVTDAQLRAWATGVQTQLVRDWAPIYGIYAELTVPAAPLAGATQFPLYVEDNSDQPGALGYHDVDGAGKPYIKVFVRDTAAAGIPLSGVISHEVLELLGDTYIESTVVVDNGGGRGAIYAAEVCDPVEGDLYKINGVQVSNFVTPWWFTAQFPSGSKFDILGKLKAPFTMTSGGYFSVALISPKTGLGAWEQRNGEKARPWNGPKS